MKKIVLFYLALVYSFLLLLSLISIITLNINYKIICVLILCVLILYSVVCLYREKVIRCSLSFLIFVNFMQLFSITVSGFIYKIILGPNVFLYFYEQSGDNLFKFSFKLFDSVLFINIDNSNNNDLLIGINFISLFLFFYFNNLLRKHLEKYYKD